MLKRRLGINGPEVGAIGIGTSGMSQPDTARYNEAESIATIHAALDAGANLVNTGDFYGMGQSEMLLGKALKGRRSQAFISLKYGGMRDPEGAFIGFDMRPVATRNFITYSLRRLGTDYIDLYQPARVDPAVPIEETIGAIADLVKAGYVRYIGLSEAGPDSIRRANAVHPITAVEAEYSLMGRDIENNVLPTAQDMGLGVVAYQVLAGGLLSGHVQTSTPTDQPSRGGVGSSRLAPGAIETNLQLIEGFREQAKIRSVTPTQLAFAWVLAKGQHVVPLVGARSRERLSEALGAIDIKLSQADVAQIDATMPLGATKGSLYGGHLHKMIQDERSR